MRARAACSRWVYRVSASNRDLLMKNICFCCQCSFSFNKATLTKNIRNNYVKVERFTCLGVTPQISKASNSVGFILNCRQSRTIQLHSRQGLAVLNEGCPFNISSNGQLFNQCGQVNILSSQLAARQCYQLSMWEQREEKGSSVLPLGDRIPA